MKNTPIKNLTAFVIVTLFSLLITACGGGGGGGSAGSGGGGAGVGVNSTPIAINSNNSKTVSGAAIDASLSTAGASNVLGIQTASGSGLSLVDITQTVSDLVARNLGNGSFVSGIVVQCSQGGSITKPNSGFIGTITFSNCAEQNSTINGSVTISGSGDFVASFNGSLVFNTLSITTSLGTDVIIGTMNLSWVDNGVTETGTLSSPSLSVSNASITAALINLLDTYTIDQNLSVSTENISFTLNSSLLAGSIAVITTQPIRSYLSSTYPYAGQIICTGANNSKLRITVNTGGTGQPTDTVTVEVDADGDGIYESSQILMWSQL